MYADGRASADRAAAMLASAGHWTRLTEFTADPAVAGYPLKFYGTLLYFDRHLWLYAEFEGTFRLSRSRASLKRHLRDLPRLLPDTRRGLISANILQPGEYTAGASVGKLRNGCFVESLNQLRKLAERHPEPVISADLLSLFIRRGERTFGHTVLTYRTSGGWHFWDPDHPYGSGQILQAGNALLRAQEVKADRDRREEVAVRPERGSGTLVSAFLIPLRVR
jgi:hypothetical protein